MFVVLVGPSFHPRAAGASLTEFSGTRNSVCVLWANPTESKDTTKTAKDTWPEAKGCTQRLQVATPCVLKRPSVCVPLLCMGTTCRAWGRPAGLCTAGGLGGDSELRELPLQRLGSVGVQSLTKSEGLYGRVCRLAGGPYWKRFLPALPFSQCRIRHFQASASPDAGSSGPGLSVPSRINEPQGRSVFFLPHRG